MAEGKRRRKLDEAHVGAGKGHPSKIGEGGDDAGRVKSRPPKRLSGSTLGIPSHRDVGLDREQAVIQRAVEVMGDREQAMRWLGTPIRALGYATPISCLHNKAGAKEIMDVLAALEPGAW